MSLRSYLKRAYPMFKTVRFYAGMMLLVLTGPGLSLWGVYVGTRAFGSYATAELKSVHMGSITNESCNGIRQRADNQLTHNLYCFDVQEVKDNEESYSGGSYEFVIDLSFPISDVEGFAKVKTGDRINLIYEPLYYYLGDPQNSWFKRVYQLSLVDENGTVIKTFSDRTPWNDGVLLLLVSLLFWIGDIWLLVWVRPYRGHPVPGGRKR